MPTGLWYNPSSNRPFRNVGGGPMWGLQADLETCCCGCPCKSTLECSYCVSTPRTYSVAFSGVTDMPAGPYCCAQLSACVWQYDDGTYKVTVTMTAAGAATIKGYVSGSQKYEADVVITKCCPLLGGLCEACDPVYLTFTRVAGAGLCQQVVGRKLALAYQGACSWAATQMVTIDGTNYSLMMRVSWNNILSDPKWYARFEFTLFDMPWTLICMESSWQVVNTVCPTGVFNDADGAGCESVITHS